MLRSALTFVLVVPVAVLVTGGPTAAAKPPGCRGHAATVVGTQGDDRLVGTSGPDVIAGLAGNDRILGLGDDDVVCGGPGADELVGGQGDDALYGGLDEHLRRDGRRTMVTGDLLEGGPGDDLLDPRADYGRRTLVARLDAVTYRNSRRAVHVDLQAGTSRGEGRDTIVRHGRLEVVGSANDDVLAGSDRADSLAGGRGDDHLSGRGGRDMITDDAGDDLLDGGPGPDLVIGREGVDTLRGGDGFDFMVAASPRSSTMLGGGGFDYMSRQFTTGPNGVIDGGPGGNQIEFMPLFYTDERIEIDVDRAAGTAIARYGAATATASFANVGAFTLWGADWTFLGTEEDDFVQVLDGPLDAHGLGGDDVLFGGESDDTLDGGDGTDEAWGGEGSNTCVDVEGGNCDGYPPHGRAVSRMSTHPGAAVVRWPGDWSHRDLANRWLSIGSSA